MGSMRRNMPSKQQTNVGAYEHKQTPMIENVQNDFLKKFTGGRGRNNRMKKK